MIFSFVPLLSRSESMKANPDNFIPWIAFEMF